REALRPASPAGPTPVPPSNQMVLLFFTSSKCPPCVVLKHSLADPSVKAALAGWQVREVKDLFTAESFGIKYYPTLVITCAGEEIDRVIGCLSPDELKSWFERSARAEHARRPEAGG